MKKHERSRAARLGHYKRNFRSVYLSATSDHHADGLMWYGDAFSRVFREALDLNFPSERLADIVAVLSPRNRWERNIADAVALVRAVRAGDPLPQVGTFRGNAEKAAAIARGEPYTLKGPKVSAFAENLKGDREAVTLDVWAWRALTRGKRTGPRSAADYAIGARAVAEVAARTGYSARTCQAITWLALRGQKGGQS